MTGALEALHAQIVDCRRCPRLVEWREQVAREKRAAFAEYIYSRNKADFEAGLVPRFASLADCYAIVGAIVELASRRIRTGIPADAHELEPVMERLVAGLIDQGTGPGIR